MLPKEIENFIEEFSKLPSVGPRMATRLAFYLSSVEANRLNQISSSLSGLDRIDRCPRCFFIKEKTVNFCAICRDLERDKSLIAVVEGETDLISIEKSGRFNGVYFILGEMSGRGSFTKKQEDRINYLKRFIEKYLGGKASEIIIAFDHNAQGDYVSGSLSEELKNHSEKLTRLGRGIPTGSEVEFADEETMAEAVNNRQPFRSNNQA